MITAQKQRAPALRFKDEDGRDYPMWNEKKLGEVAIFFSGGTPNTAVREYYTGSIPFIKSGEISSSSTEQFISEEGMNNSSARRVNKGDILYALYGATSGEVAISKIDGAINQAVLCIRSKLIPPFLYFYLSLKKRNIVSTFIQGGQGNLSAQIVKSLKISLPCPEEQQKIATFLSAVDTKIEQLNRKKSLLEQYKKGMMQKLFSQEIRFKDEDGKDYPDWEEKLLGAISKLSKGKGISKSDVVAHGTLKCIRYGELYTHYGTTISRVISSTDIPPSQLELSNKNDVIIPSSGETASDIATAACLRLDGVALGGDINIIRCQQNGVFLAYYLNYKKPDIARLAQGISVIHLYASQLRLLKLGIPSKEEQQKIADFFSAIDRKIDLVAGQIEQARSFKQGLLQQMFI